MLIERSNLAFPIEISPVLRARSFTPVVASRVAPPHLARPAGALFCFEIAVATEGKIRKRCLGAKCVSVIASVLPKGGGGGVARRD